MALHGDVRVNGEKLFEWEAVNQMSEYEETNKTGDKRIVDRYACKVAYADGRTLEFETTLVRGDPAETLATKVLLNAAWNKGKVK